FSSTSTPPSYISPLSLHDALPILVGLVNFAPILLLAAFWFFMIRQMQTGGNKALSFGKSRARLLSMQQKKVTFKDVAGSTAGEPDRKSTRLNSSHLVISYAVFCLK